MNHPTEQICAGRGRGRASVLPAWMTESDLQKKIIKKSPSQQNSTVLNNARRKCSSRSDSSNQHARRHRRDSTSRSYSPDSNPKRGAKRSRYRSNHRSRSPVRSGRRRSARRSVSGSASRSTAARRRSFSDDGSMQQKRGSTSPDISRHNRRQRSSSKSRSRYDSREYRRMNAQSLSSNRERRYISKRPRYPSPRYMHYRDHSRSRFARRRRSPDRYSIEKRRSTGRNRSIDKRYKSRTPDKRFRSRSPEKRFRSRSPDKRVRSRSPEKRIRSRSSDKRVRSRTPDKRIRSRTPDKRIRSDSPDKRVRNRSAEKRVRSRSPEKRIRSQSPDKRSRNRSVEKRSRNRSPEKRIKSRSRSRRKSISLKRPDTSSERRRSKSSRHGSNEGKPRTCQLCDSIIEIRNIESPSKRSSALKEFFDEYIRDEVFTYETADGSRHSCLEFKKLILESEGTYKITRRIVVEDANKSCSYCLDFELGPNKATDCTLLVWSQKPSLGLLRYYKFEDSENLVSPESIDLQRLKATKIWAVVKRYLRKKGVSSSAACCFVDLLANTKSVFTLESSESRK